MEERWKNYMPFKFKMKYSLLLHRINFHDQICTDGNGIVKSPTTVKLKSTAYSQYKYLSMKSFSIYAFSKT